MINIHQITIITVVYNAIDCIEKTLKSVIDQTYQYIEYIIIDGASNDGTIDLIRKYENNISKWITEKDNGIYDAMNKGLEIAEGDWIIFMNAGDVFYNNYVVEDFIQLKNDAFDLIYGSVEISIRGFKYIEKPKKNNILWKGMIFSHQSCFVKLPHLKKYPFDSKLKIAADFKQILTLKKAELRFHEIDLIVSTVSGGGISDKMRIKSIMERFTIVLNHYPVRKVFLHYSFLVIRESTIALIKYFLPNRLIEYYLQNKAQI